MIKLKDNKVKTSNFRVWESRATKFVFYHEFLSFQFLDNAASSDKKGDKCACNEKSRWKGTKKGK